MASSSFRAAPINFRLKPGKSSPIPRASKLGILLQMLKDYEAVNKTGTVYNFLIEQFSRISPARSAEFCKAIGIHTRTKCSDIEPTQVEQLFKEFLEAKLPPPPTDCLAPIGVRQLLAGMLKGVKAEFYAASSREPDVYRGVLSRLKRRSPLAASLNQMTPPASSALRIVCLCSSSRAPAAASKRALRRGGKTTTSASPAAAPYRTAGHHDPHGQRMGSVHKRIEGSDRGLR